MTHLQGCFQGPWLFIGDFNAVLGAHEKRGRRDPPPLSCIDFMNWLNVNLLHLLSTLGPMGGWAHIMFFFVLIGQFVMKIGSTFGVPLLVLL